jgi:dipeptidyl aminopeptidase/acylaminoacyl peptidase
MYRIARILAAVSWLALAFPLQPAAAQDKRLMSLVDLLGVPSLDDPQLSPDGRQLIYTLAQADWKANRRISHIWRINTDGSGAIQLTNGERGESSPRWSPDGRVIAFLAQRGDNEQNQIYLIDNAGGEARELTRHETGVSSITWSPDGKWIYFLASDPKSAEQRERERSRDDVYAFEEDYQQRHLWKVSVPEGREERISQGDYSVLAYSLSRDGTRIVFHRAPNPLLDHSWQSEIWIMNADGSGAVQLTRNRVAESRAELSPDNSRVLFTAAVNRNFEVYYNDKLFLLSASGGDPQILLEDLPYEIGEAHWSADGRFIFFTANLGVHSQLFQLEISGNQLRQLTEGNHAIRSWEPSPRGDVHVLALDQPTNPGDLWVLERPGRPLRKVTRVFDYLEREFELPRQEKIQWKGADGITVEGLLHYPIGYRPGTRYPLVVQTHGGPRASDKYGFAGGIGSYVPVLAAKGYAVLRPNYRGSTGYGDDFLRDMVGHYFNNAHLDVLAGVDHVIAMGVADPDRLVKMGWSAGGHMTNKIITFTDRFKAASSGAGAINWISMYGQSDVRHNRTPWFGGTPWQRDAPIDVYWEHSPLKYIAQVKTPTLILVGERDERVPMPQSVELYRALKSNGVPTRLYVAPREPHGWRELRHQLFKMNAELDWFERYAMNRTYVWEKPPTDAGREVPRVSPQP